MLNQGARFMLKNTIWVRKINFFENMSNYQMAIIVPQIGLSCFFFLLENKTKD